MRDYEFYYTQDGSIGLYSYTDEDVYHSKYGALTEAWEKFILPSGIDKLLNTKENINVLDLCYGVGYNTKALMSYVIHRDENLLKQNNILKKIHEKIKKKILANNKYNESIDNDKNKDFRKELSMSIDSNNREIISKVYIDCLELNKELVKLSPFLKTVFTPQEIYMKFVPKFLDCFETYWTIRKKLAKFTLKIALRNGKKITDANIKKFAETVLEDINPRDSWRAGKALRQHISVVMAERALRDCVEQAGGEVDG